MAILKFASEDFEEVLPLLVEVWPHNGKWDKKRLAILKAIIQKHGASNPPNPLLVNMAIGKDELEHFGERVAVNYSTPWKYQKYFNPSTPLDKQALRLKPGAKVSLHIESVPTNGRIDTIRRITHQGSPNWIKSQITWDATNIPLWLDGETKCNCKYCGTKPKGDDEECRKCGAPLPDC